MKLTNNYDLPEPIENAVRGFEKSYMDGRGDTDFSVTQLIDPPIISRLIKAHYDEIEEDVSSRIWQLVGSSVHGILEHSTDLSTEERMFVEVNGKKISGQADLIDGDKLIDYKVTSTWSVINGYKKEWEQQLNLLAYLCKENGKKIESLQIVAILRDWSKGRANSPDYPQCPVHVIDIPLWDDCVQKGYLEERIKVHTAEGLTQCTEAERWARPTKYACMKKGRKSAVKLFEVRGDCEDLIKEKGVGHYLEERPGEDVRCEGYCLARPYCPYKTND